MRKLILLISLAGCGGGSTEPDAPAEPQRHIYDCDRARVFKAVAEAMRTEQGPLELEDATNGLVSGGFHWYEHDGRKKPAGQPIHKDDLGILVEVAVVQATGGAELRGAVRVFKPSPASSRGRELSTRELAWPKWANDRLASVLSGAATKLKGCSEGVPPPAAAPTKKKPPPPPKKN